ncbi:MAG TPA: hydroxymethylbilane synthase, partial [Acidaminococcaceae bacterium]|nr:hydroxymethylbilane synthase [Acidaminococcaceae bacterium]
MKQSIIIGTRKSLLALWQSNYIKSCLEKRYPELKVELQKIVTTGDKILDVPLAQIGGKGLFTKEIETDLLERKIDLAVHSLKD